MIHWTQLLSIPRLWNASNFLSNGFHSTYLPQYRRRSVGLTTHSLQPSADVSNAWILIRIPPTHHYATSAVQSYRSNTTFIAFYSDKYNVRLDKYAPTNVIALECVQRYVDESHLSPQFNGSFHVKFSYLI
jgi:hypothetical protein